MPRLINHTDLATYLGISRQTLLAWNEKGYIERTQKGSERIYDLDEVLSAIKQHRLRVKNNLETQPCPV